jgi:hypothetical protein
MTEPPVPPPGGGPKPPDWGEMGQKLRGAQGPNRLILFAGLLFLVDSFVPWYGFKVSILGQRLGANFIGWNSGFLAVVAILLAIAATVLAAMEVLGTMKEMSVPSGTLALALSGGAFVFTLLRWLTATHLVKYGLFIALILGAVMTYGGYQKFQAQS